MKIRVIAIGMLAAALLSAGAASAQASEKLWLNQR
jgi:hypothetical protein